MNLLPGNLSPEDAAAFERTLARFRAVGTSCSHKRSYHSRDEAETVVSAYNCRVALQFGEYSSYWCRRHACWHTGHRGGRAAASRCLQLATAISGGTR